MIVIKDELKNRLIQTLSIANFPVEILELNDCIRIKLNMTNISGYFTYATFDIHSEEELEKFIEPFSLVTQINTISDKKITITYSGGLRVDGAYELEYYNENMDKLTINELRRIAKEDLELENEKLRNGINDINKIVDRIHNLLKKYNDIEINYTELIKSINKTKNNSNKIFGVVGKIDLKLSASVTKYSDTMLIDLLEILNLYTRESFGLYDLQAQEIKNTIKFKLNEIISLILGGEKIKFDESLINFEGIELEKMKKVKESLFNIFSNIEQKISASLDIREQKLNELIHEINIINSLPKRKGYLKLRNLDPTIKDMGKYKLDDIEVGNLTVCLVGALKINADKYHNDSQFYSYEIYDSLIGVEKDQNELLTEDEKTAVLIYKTQLYRAMNQIIAYMRQNNLTYDQLINDSYTYSIIAKSYNEMVDSSKNEKCYTRTNIPLIDKIFDKYADNLGIPPLSEYGNLVLYYMPIVENALKKIVLKEDIVVYRGVPNDSNFIPNQFISTSLSPRTAKDFAEREIENGGNIKGFYKIVLPAGSPVIAYTNELFGHKTNQYPMSADRQREILLDSSLYEFEYVNNKYSYVNIDGINEPLNSIELVAHPKEDLFRYDREK